MERSGTPGYWEQSGAYRLWVGILLAPAAWALNQLIGYALVKPVCASGHRTVLTVLALVMLGMVVAGGTIGWSSLVQLRGAAENGGTREDRSYFMAHIALWFNLLIGLLILLAAVPPFVLNPCE